MAKEFVSFNKDLTLVVTRAGCKVLRDNILVMQGNNDMGTFLLNCNGEKAVSDIVKEHTDNQEHYEQSMAYIAPFVDDLVRKEIVSLTGEPRPVSPNVKHEELLVPSVVSLELTDRCNFRCVYCYQECTPEKSKHLQNPVEILTLLKNMGVVGIELTGGEPTLHPQFMDILQYACDNFTMVGLITNGSLLRHRMLEMLQEGSAIPTVQICLDGPDKSTVDSTDGMPGAWEHVLKGIQMVKQHHLRLRVGMILDDISKIDLIEETLLLAKGMGADLFVATPAINFGRATNANSLSQSFMEKFISVHGKLKKKYGEFYASESELWDPRISAGCGAGHRDITVTPEGLVKICSMQPSEWLNFGHIMDIESQHTQELFSAFSQLPTPSIETCSECEHFTYCLNCYTRAFNLLTTGSMSPENCNWYRQHESSLSQFHLHRRQHAVY